MTDIYDVMKKASPLQMLEAVKAFVPEGESDSYVTYIEDPLTMERAPFQFHLGPKDGEALVDYIKNLADYPMIFLCIMANAPVKNFLGFLK